MNECYSGRIKGSAVQSRGRPSASHGQLSSSGLPHQNTAKIQRSVSPGCEGAPLSVSLRVRGLSTNPREAPQPTSGARSTHAAPPVRSAACSPSMRIAGRRKLQTSPFPSLPNYYQPPPPQPSPGVPGRYPASSLRLLTSFTLPLPRLYFTPPLRLLEGPLLGTVHRPQRVPHAEEGATRWWVGWLVGWSPLSVQLSFGGSARARAGLASLKAEDGTSWQGTGRGQVGNR
jgi:hypothetical protein